MQFGVVGYGIVGKHMVRDIEGAGQAALIYDPAYTDYDGPRAQCRINACDAVFICVPTPSGDDGTLDMSHIWDVFAWLDVPVAIIRSALAIGTADRLFNEGHNVAVSPEFIGEGVHPPYVEMAQPPFIILGGQTQACRDAAQALSHIYNSECEVIFMTAREAEIAKLCENYFLALKVGWANEVYEICKHFGANYERMMAGLTHDYRIGRSHTHVYRDDRGWSSKCLDKDVPGLLAQAGAARAPLLEALLRVNRWHRTLSRGSE